MRHRRRSQRALTANLGDRGWYPRAQISPAPKTCWEPTQRMRAILAALAALPKIAAAVGLSVAARPDAAVEVLPGEPGTVIFSAGGSVKALFMIPASEQDARRLLGLPVVERDRDAETLFEEQRRQIVADVGNDPSDETWEDYDAC